MRISTSMIYNVNVANINRQQSSVLHTQQQLSTGRRVVSPSDDPVAAARALEVSQSIARVELQTKNQGTAMDALKNLDSQLGAIGEVLDYVRERVVQAGNGSLSIEDKKAIATDIRSQFDSLLNLSNTRDAEGEYLFSGYMGDTQPFSGNIASVAYQGDQGVRTLQISNTRHIPSSVSGNELFMNISSVNGAFSTASSSMTALISDGTVSGPQPYNGEQYGIRFTSATTFEVFDTAADPTMAGAPLSTGTYVEGAQIFLPDPGDASTAQIQVSIAGNPAAGDSFSVTPGNTTDMFGILQNVVVGLENAEGEGYEWMISDALGQLDNALENVLRLRSQVGSRQVEVEALENIGADLKIQYADRMERLVGLDWVQAISDFQQQNTYLEASRNTFSKISGLSLFNFIS
jgi:flagellar hook-associated protein 3 FlgL